MPLFGLSGTSFAGQLTLAWDAVANATGYKVHFGQSSGTYTASVDAGNKLNQAVTGLNDGTRYYFAVTAYGPQGTTESGFSNQVSAVVPTTSTPPPTPAPPVASFTASPTSGTAPLVVTLTDTSTGTVTSRSWNLGDGTSATSTSVNKTYSTAKTYTVTLTVTGSSGSTTATKSISVSAPSGGGGSVGGGTGGGTGSNSGLVASYSFEETSGSQVKDASGNANNGTLSGATRIATGRFGRALKFNGTSDWVTVDHSASLNLTKGMTLEAWVYPTTSSTSTPATILMKEASGTASYRIYTHANSGPRPTSIINIGGASKTLLGGPTLPVNTWSHVAATYDGATHKLYVNGELVNSQSQTGSIDVSTGKLRIGGNSVWGYYFAGYIDEVRVYNRALSEAEIGADSNAAGTGSGSQGEIVIDNAAAGAADATRRFTGTWCVSSASGPYGADSLYSCGSGVDTYRWTPVIATAGTYNVYVRWPQHPNRSTAVPITVRHSGGTTTPPPTFNEQSG
ncbi:MAG: LamG-like jellyroll fold domain-containing protein, partial [Burkholderiales bacterium]